MAHNKRNSVDPIGAADYAPDPEIENLMEEEIARAPNHPQHLAERLR